MQEYFLFFCYIYSTDLLQRFLLCVVQPPCPSLHAALKTGPAAPRFDHRRPLPVVQQPSDTISCFRKILFLFKSSSFASCDTLCDTLHMATNVQTDPDLIRDSQLLGGKRTKREIIEEALQEYGLRRKQQQLLKLLGTFDYDPEYDYKKKRPKAVKIILDTSVWSLAIRRRTRPADASVAALRELIEDGHSFSRSMLMRLKKQMKISAAVFWLSF